MESELVKLDLQVEVLKGMKLMQYTWGYLAEKSGVVVGSQTLADIPELLTRAIHSQKV
ncbi:hypothetical protein SAMN05216167_13812 [Spirosoma endophyticum]|uniref:Uncharacterized protein n=1 Tax=Spirosoma endophyticum TaxID=662367 RepID=A0A1I2H515_9BACT|nr:hypothetical protein SAMN05216167_13812 [Spirosoma endophyticum]